MIVELYYGLKCNCQCSYCIAKQPGRVMGLQLSRQALDKIVKIIINCPKPVDHIAVLGGEPALADDVVDAFQAFRETDVVKEISVITNGHLAERLKRYVGIVKKTSFLATAHVESFVHGDELDEKGLQTWLDGLHRLCDRAEHEVYMIYKLLLSPEMLDNPAHMRLAKTVIADADAMGFSISVDTTRVLRVNEFAQNVRLKVALAKHLEDDETVARLNDLFMDCVFNRLTNRLYGKPCPIWSDLWTFFENETVFNCFCNIRNAVPLDDVEKINAMLYAPEHLCHVKDMRMCDASCIYDNLKDILTK